MYHLGLLNSDMFNLYNIFFFIKILLILNVYIAFNRWHDYEDDLLTLANRLHKFDISTPHIIEKTDSYGVIMTQPVIRVNNLNIDQMRSLLLRDKIIV